VAGVWAGELGVLEVVDTHRLLRRNVRPEKVKVRRNAIGHRGGNGHPEKSNGEQRLVTVV
jgi:hypothetical protein